MNRIPASLPCPLCQDALEARVTDGETLVICAACKFRWLVSPQGEMIHPGIRTSNTKFELELGPEEINPERQGYSPTRSGEPTVLDPAPEPDKINGEPVLGWLTASARVVIAIDFGTSRSGYAFAFVRDKQVHCRIQWPDQPFPYVKTLSNLLHGPAGEMWVWGYSAREELARRVRAGTAQGYHLVHQFKPMLHRGEPSPQGPLLRLPSGKTVPVVDLIAVYLCNLKTYALMNLQGGGSGLFADEDIRWCLTVPAIWTDADKRWMRRAAELAGLVGSGPDAARLCLVLEPEAAALYCLEKERATDPNLDSFPAGTRFMVVDAGGGTVDITVHEVGLGGKWLNEVIAGGGGLHGARDVDNAFEELLRRRLGGGVVRKLAEREPHAFAKLLDDWEMAKCKYHPGRERTFVPLPAELYKLLVREHPKVLDRLSGEQGGEDSSLILDRAVMEEMFRAALDGITNQVRRHFEKLGAIPCDYLFLVGGFAASPLLQRRIVQEFGGRVKKIIIPPDPGAAVVSGAVYYGLDPARIRARRSRLTYGCRTLAPFEEGVDPAEKKVWSKDAGRFLCRNRFRPFVVAGEAVDINREVLHEFHAPRKGQKKVKVSFFATARRQARYTDEAEVMEVGRVEVDIPEPGGTELRKVQIGMFFGGTEITVKARDVGSGAEARATVDFSGGYLAQEAGPDDAAT